MMELRAKQAKTANLGLLEASVPTPQVLPHAFLNQLHSSLEVSSGIPYVNASTISIRHVLSSLPSRTSLYCMLATTLFLHSLTAITNDKFLSCTIPLPTRVFKI